MKSQTSRRPLPARALLILLLLPGVAAPQNPTPIFSAETPRAQLSPEQARRYDHYAALPATARIRAAELIEAPRAALRLSLFPDSDYQVALDSADRWKDGSYTWRGTIKNFDGQVILVVRGHGQVTGWIWATHGPGDKRFFSISPLGGRMHVVRQTNQAWFDSVTPGCNVGEAAGTRAANASPALAVPRPLTRAAAQGRGAAAAPAGRDVSSGGEAAAVGPRKVSAVGLAQEAAAAKGAAFGCKVNVLVAYTPAAKNAHGDIQGLAQLAVDQANATYQNSKINNLSLNLISTLEVNYAESGTKQGIYLTDFLRLLDPGDGFMDQVHAARAAAGADVVVLLLNNLAGVGSAGITGQTLDGMATHDTAFAVVDWEFAVDNLTFAHEIGHLQGARHQPETDPNPSPYGHGHGACRGWPYEFRTVMARKISGCEHPRIPYWSNPDVKYSNRATGDHTKRNNARVLRETACTVADFVGPPAMGWIYRWGNGGGGKINWWHVGPADRYAVGDFDGDGADELLAANPNGWSHLMEFDGANWKTPWINHGSGVIDSWRIRNGDIFVAGDFIAGNGRDELLAVNPAGSYAHLMRFDGANWSTPWANWGSGLIDSWRLRNGDSFVAGDFLSGNGRDELLAVTPTGGYAHLMRFDAGNWGTPWANWGNGIIDSWRLRSGDSYVAGDFVAGNARDELLAVHPSGYSHLMRFDGPNWATPWANGGDGAINWWRIGGSDRYVVGDFITGDGRAELLSVALHNGWSQLASYPNPWQTPWHNIGSGNIGAWLIGGPDRYLAGKFVPGEARAVLLSIQPQNGWSHLHSR